MTAQEYRRLADRLSAIEEGEIGRKIGSTIGSIFGDTGAKIGGDLGDKAGDLLDKLNPFSKKVEKPTDTTDHSGDKPAGASVSTSTSGSTNADNSVNTPQNAPTGGSKYDIENQYAVDPSAFRIARNWRDGTTGLDANGMLINDYTHKEVPPEILHIEPREGWNKPMVNFDGRPILAGDEASKPKEPDHPYYHLIHTKGSRAGERQDPLRVYLISLLEKDRYGYQRQHYKDSKSPTITCSIPKGYTSGGMELIKKHLVGGKDVIGCWKNNDGGVVCLEWQHRNLRMAHTIDGQIQNVSQTLSAEEIEQYYKGTKVDNVGHNLTANSAVGKWYGNSVTASGGIYESGGTFANLTQSVPSMDSQDTPHVDLYNIFYWGPTSDWSSSGKQAINLMASTAKYAEGFGPIKPKSMNEELSRILDLVRAV